MLYTWAQGVSAVRSPHSWRPRRSLGALRPWASRRCQMKKASCVTCTKRRRHRWHRGRRRRRRKAKWSPRWPCCRSARSRSRRPQKTLVRWRCRCRRLRSSLIREKMFRRRLSWTTAPALPLLFLLSLDGSRCAKLNSRCFSTSTADIFQCF